MALIITLAYRVSRIRGDYVDIHEQVLGFSVRKMLARWGRKPDYANLEDKMSGLQDELRTVEETISCLDEEDMPRRSRREICLSLMAYCDALSTAMEKLKVICAGLRQEKEGVKTFARYTDTRFKQDRIAYDDAVQHLRSWGIKLNELFSSF